MMKKKEKDVKKGKEVPARLLSLSLTQTPRINSSKDIR